MKEIKTTVDFIWVVPDDASEKDIFDSVNGQIVSDMNVYCQNMGGIAVLKTIKICTDLGENDGKKV